MWKCNAEKDDVVMNASQINATAGEGVRKLCSKALVKAYEHADDGQMNKNTRHCQTLNAMQHYRD